MLSSLTEHFAKLLRSWGIRKEWVIVPGRGLLRRDGDLMQQGALDWILKEKRRWWKCWWNPNKVWGKFSILYQCYFLNVDQHTMVLEDVNIRGGCWVKVSGNSSINLKLFQNKKLKNLGVTIFASKLWSSAAGQIIGLETEQATQD